MDRIRVDESQGELLHQVAGTSESMWLKKHVNSAEAAIPGGPKSCQYLGRMMAVVVDDRDTMHHPFRLEAAVDTSKRRQASGDLLGGDAELNAYGNRGGRIQDVVATGHMEIKGPELRFAVPNGEGGVRPTPFRKELHAEVGFGVLPIGVELAIRHGGGWREDDRRRGKPLWRRRRACGP